MERPNRTIEVNRQVIGRSELPIGSEFYTIINGSVLNEISKAMVSLHVDLLYLDPETANGIIEEMISASKKVVDCYIEQQKTTLLMITDVV